MLYLCYRTFAFLCKTNKKYVTVKDSFSPLIGSADKVGESETFEIVLVDERRNYIALRACVNNLYVSAGKGGSLIANQPRIGRWETFEEVKFSDGTRLLKSIANNFFVCAESGGLGSLIANRSYAKECEEFEFVQQPWG
jgi:hypothetical protein